MKARMATTVIVIAIGTVANLVSYLSGVSTNAQIAIILLSAIITAIVAVYEIKESKKESAAVKSKLGTHELELQLYKANQDWKYQKANFNMQWEGEKGKKIYVEILKTHLTNSQIMQLKRNGLLEKILSAKTGGAIYLEVEESDL